MRPFGAKHRESIAWKATFGVFVFAIALCHPALAANKFALLVGCTKYANLPASFQLQGPGNDVLLMRDLLIERFGFVKKDIVVLSEAAGGESTRPTRANIAREFQRLAEASHRGDQVVILLGGHGSEQPQKDPPDPDDIEPDGFDQVFLPADVGKWDGSKGTIVNAIVDNDIHAWLQAFEKNGPLIWVVIDACHSGTMCRGADDEVARQIPADFLIPEATLQEAASKAAVRFGPSRGSPSEAPRLDLTDKRPNVVALYAAQASEVTVEKLLPIGSPYRRPYGLLTYTLNQILRRSPSPLTYNELIQRIHAQYVQMGRTTPTPMIEGELRDREVLGTRDWPGRSRIVLKEAGDELTINAGAVLGLTAHSILAVNPPVGQPRGDRPLGYVEVIECRTIDSTVQLCDYAGTTADRGKLPPGGVCVPVRIDYGEIRVRVAVDRVDHRGEPVSETMRQSLIIGLRKRADTEGASIEIVGQTDRADWLVRCNKDDVYLVPASGVPMQSKTDALPACFGPAPKDAHRMDWILDRLERITKARNLIRMASDPDEVSRGAGVKVDIDFRLLSSKRDLVGLPLVNDGRGIKFHDGDRIGVRVRNSNRFPVDVTLLYVDSGFGISSLYPREGEINRLPVGGTIPSLQFRVTSDTLGLEHLMAIAVRAGEGQALDFSLLSQPTLEKARAMDGTRGGSASLDSPLGQWFQHTVFGRATSRGAASDPLGESSLRVYSWQIIPGKQPPNSMR